MAQHFLDKKRIAFRLRENQIHQFGRRRLAGATLDDLLHGGLVETLEHHLLYQPLARQFLQGPGKRPFGVQLVIPVGPDDQHRGFPQTVRQMTNEDAGGVVCPVQVFEDQHYGLVPGAALDEVTDAVQQITPLLVRRQFRRFADVRELLTQLRHELRHLRGVLAETRPQIPGRYHPGYLRDLVEQRLVGWCAFHVETVAGEHQKVSLPRRIRDLPGEPRLPHTRLPGKDESSAFVLFQPAQLLEHPIPLLLPAAEGRLLAAVPGGGWRSKAPNRFSNLLQRAGVIAVDGLDSAERQRWTDFFNGYRNQIALLESFAGLRAHPLGLDGLSRPDHHDALGLVDGLFDFPVVGGARIDPAVPPDTPAGAFQRADELAHTITVFGGIGDEDVRHARRSRMPVSAPHRRSWRGSFRTSSSKWHLFMA
jgi:hypothetical protein